MVGSIDGSPAAVAIGAALGRVADGAAALGALAVATRRDAGVLARRRSRRTRLRGGLLRLRRLTGRAASATWPDGTRHTGSARRSRGTGRAGRPGRARRARRTGS